MGGNVVGIVDIGEMNSHSRSVISVVGIAIHEEEFGI